MNTNTTTSKANKASTVSANNSKVSTPTSNSKKNPKSPTYTKKAKANEQPKPFWFFILFMGGIFISLVAWLGSISTEFPWLVLCGGCATLAASIGLWLWGYNSHKPEVRVKVEYVYVCDQAPQVKTSVSPEREFVPSFLDEIYNDPDLQDDDGSKGTPDSTSDS